jgi:hypothetical protein
MKKAVSWMFPFLLLVMALVLMSQFKYVETLSREEKQAIKTGYAYIEKVEPTASAEN